MSERPRRVRARCVPPTRGWELAARFEALDPSADFAGSPAWNRAALATLGAAAALHVVFEDGGGEPVGYAMFVRTRAGWRSGSPGQQCIQWPMQALGFGFRPRWCGSAVDPAWIDALRELVPSARLELERCDAAAVSQQDRELQEVREGIGTWVRREPGSTDAYLAALKGKHRRDLLKYRRDIAAVGATWDDSRDADRARLDECFTLHRARLTAKRKRSAYFARSSERFLKELALATSGRELRISILRGGTTAIAACLSFVHRGRYKAFVSGWDRSHPRLDLGRQVLFHQILGELAEGLHEIDLLGGDLAYKREFGLHRAATRNVIVWPSAFSRLRERMVGAARAGWRKVSGTTPKPGQARLQTPPGPVAPPAEGARKVVYVSATDELGGSDTSLFELIACLDRARFTPEVVLPFEGAFAARYRAAGIPVHIVPLRKLKNTRNPLWHLAWLAQAPLRIGRLLRLFVQTRPAIVHVNSCVEALAGLAARAYGTTRGARLVWHVRELDLRPRIVGAAIYALVRWWADGVVAISSPIAAKMASWERVYLIPNGVDIERFAGRSHVRTSVPTIGWVGRIAPRKGLENVIDVAAMVARTFPGLRLLIVAAVHESHRQLARDLEQRAAASGVTVEWVPGNPRVETAFAAMDMFLHLPDLDEGLGRTVLEAQAAGVPVVCWPKGGLVDALSEGETGCFAPPGDLEGTARLVVELLEHPERLRAMSAAARSFAAQGFARETCARRIEAAYDAVLA